MTNDERRMNDQSPNTQQVGYWTNDRLLRPNVLAFHFARLAVGRACAVVGFFQIAMWLGHKMLLQIDLMLIASFKTARRALQQSTNFVGLCEAEAMAHSRL